MAKRLAPQNLAKPTLYCQKHVSLRQLKQLDELTKPRVSEICPGSPSSRLVESASDWTFGQLCSVACF